MVQQVTNIVDAARQKVVKADDFKAFRDEAIAQMGPKKTRASGDQCSMWH
jgi:hypothetical protein